MDFVVTRVAAELRAVPDRASARSARGKFSPQMFVRSDPDFPAVFAADSKFSSFVRKIYYSVELYMHMYEDSEQVLPAD
jgi:hypothetical protein